MQMHTLVPHSRLHRDMGEVVLQEARQPTLFASDIGSSAAIVGSRRLAHKVPIMLYLAQGSRECLQPDKLTSPLLCEISPCRIARSLGR